MIFFCFPYYGKALSYEEACRHVHSQLEEARSKLKKNQLTIGQEREELRRKGKDLLEEQTRIRVIMAKMKEEERFILASLDKQDEIHHRLQTQWHQIRETITFYLGEIEPLQQMMVLHQDEGKNLLDSLLAFPQNHYPHKQVLPVLKTISLWYATWFDQGSRVMEKTRDIFSDSGRKIHARVLTVGLLGGCYWHGGEAGIVSLSPDISHLQIYRQGLSLDQKNLLKSESNSTIVLLDVSAGMALQQLQKKQTWSDLFRAGGMVMVPLGVIAIVALLMIIERIFFYFFLILSLEKLRKRLLDVVKGKNYQEALDIIRSHHGLGRRFWEKSIYFLQRESRDTETIFHQVILSELPALERFLSILAVFAAICPLLGLLGTVNGMIKTFEVITVYGTGNTSVLSQGISEALITTQTGLVLAIPILLAHATLVRYMKSILVKMDQILRTMIDSSSLVGKR